MCAAPSVVRDLVSVTDDVVQQSLPERIASSCRRLSVPLHLVAEPHRMRRVQRRQYLARGVMEEIANWVAPIATTIAAVMVAANLGARLTGFGFIVFCVGSIGWMIVGFGTGQMNLVWQNALLLVVNLVGVWRWLGLRAGYEKGAAVATRASTGRH